MNSVDLDALDDEPMFEKYAQKKNVKAQRGKSKKDMYRDERRKREDEREEAQKSDWNPMFI